MEVQELIAALEKKKAELRREYELNISNLDATIRTLSGASAFATPTNGSSDGITVKSHIREVPDVPAEIDKSKYHSYFAEKAFKRKVVSIIVAENRFMHIREIAEIMTKIDPEKAASSDDLPKDISIALFASKKDRDSTLTSITIGKMLVDSFWGSRNWLDEQGKPKAKYMYDEKQLSEHRKQKTVL